MRRFLLGAINGLGVGSLLGWSLGVSGIIPGEGWPLWAVTVLGIALIGVGATGLRGSGIEAPSPPGTGRAEPGAAPDPAG